MTVYSVTINGNTYTGDNNPTTGMGVGGYRTRFLPALNDVVAVAAQAAASAAAAAIPASGLQVSTTPTAGQIPALTSEGVIVVGGAAISAMDSQHNGIAGGLGGSILFRNASPYAQTYISSNVSGAPYAGSYKINGPAMSMILDGSTGAFKVNTAASGTAGGAITWTTRLIVSSAGVLAGTDNAITCGGPSNRFSTVYAGTGTINTSDAREKTPVVSLTDPEIAAAKDLAKEIGSYQFLSAVAAKGAEARHHIGMTVQRAIEVMTAHGLDPFRYGFICHDEWAATETEPAGDRYSFRPDELLLFIARGFEARLSALEAK